MKNYTILTILLLAFPCVAQVGIGTTTPNATLEIKSSDETTPASTDGILIPKINNFPATNPTANQHGMLVWYSNTTTPTLEGFYYWNHTQTKWTPLFSSKKGWSLTGNAGTTAVNFIGTTDDKPLRFRVNNQPAGEITTTNNNLSLGYEALSSNTTGSDNVVFGNYALKNALGSTYSVAIGQYALNNIIYGQENIAIGYNALSNATFNFGSIAIGSQALNNSTSEYWNLAIGSFAMQYNTLGSYNTSLGHESLALNTTGSQNTAIGQGSMLYNSTGNKNVALGTGTLLYNYGGNENVAIGHGTAFNSRNTTRNCSLGYQALYYNRDGNHNVAMGDHALYNSLTSGNTALGSGALMNLTTGANNTAVGFQAGLNLPATVTNTTSIGNGAGFATTTSNQINVGNFNVNWIGGATNWATYSDARIKDNIQYNVPGLAFIKELKPVTYNLNTSKQYEIANPGKKDESDDWEGKHDIEQIKQTGFLAQEVAQAAKKLGYDFNGVHAPKNGQGLYSISYATFVVPLVKAVQEQQQQIESLTTQNQQLELRLQQLEQLVTKISNNN